MAVLAAITSFPGKSAPISPRLPKIEPRICMKRQKWRLSVDEETPPLSDNQPTRRKKKPATSSIFSRPSIAEIEVATIHIQCRWPSGTRRVGTDRVVRVPSFQARCYGAIAGLIIGGTIGSPLFAFFGIAPFFPGDLMYLFAILLAIVVPFLALTGSIVRSKRAGGRRGWRGAWAIESISRLCRRFQMRIFSISTPQMSPSLRNT